jgi:hypothetical protein
MIRHYPVAIASLEITLHSQAARDRLVVIWVEGAGLDVRPDAQAGVLAPDRLVVVKFNAACFDVCLNLHGFSLQMMVFGFGRPPRFQAASPYINLMRRLSPKTIIREKIFCATSHLQMRYPPENSIKQKIFLS